MRFGIEICIGKKFKLIGYEKGKIGVHQQPGTINASGLYVSVVAWRFFVGVGGGLED